MIIEMFKKTQVKYYTKLFVNVQGNNQWLILYKIP